MLFTNLTRHTEIGANCYSLEVAGKKVVFDSGLHPRERGQSALPRFDLLRDDSADAIFLTHAHHDHLGSLPVLMRRQPHALAWMSETTRNLAEVMLHNSVNVMLRQKEEFELHDYPLFSHREVDQTVKRWRSCPLHQRVSIEGERLRPDEPAEVAFELFDAGHVLGAVGVRIEAEGKKLFYTGDVNFEDQTISRAARFPEQDVDILVIETTRGDSPTPEGYSRATEEMRLAQALKTAFDRGGCVIIPVFALGKTQEILAMFYEFRRKRLLGNVPIYIGGLSTKLTEIYDKFAHTAPRQRPDLQILDQVAPFVIAGKSAGETQLQKSRIYALSSGMMTENTLSYTFARRILSNPQHSLFFVGYADPISPAGKIRAAAPGGSVVLRDGEPPIPIQCTIEKFNFSGHASRESIRAYVNKLRPKKIVLVHGDPNAIEWFRGTLSTDLPESEIIIPLPGIPVEL